ncbi:MAG TPA: hypothetical protein VJS20_09410 [Gemmatimonadales bacterium]|nr:hypothetical protein [Gemmatimonadales bacterium]
MPEKTKDSEAPPSLTLEIKTSDGKIWGTVVAAAKEFKTGSVGYYAGEKVTNPKSGARYQLGVNIILIGSKGEA